MPQIKWVFESKTRSIVEDGGWGRIVCHFENKHNWPFENWESNTHLIAAAPDLLEALEFCASVLKEGGLFERSEQIAFDQATSSITKAKGGNK
jgi:hypothetical protein